MDSGHRVAFLLRLSIEKAADTGGGIVLKAGIVTYYDQIRPGDVARCLREWGATAGLNSRLARPSDGP